MVISIQTRLIFLAVVSLASLSITALISVQSLREDVSIVNNLYNDRIVPLRDLKVIADMYAVNIVDTSHKARNGNISWEQARQNVDEAQKTIHEKWQGYLGTVLVPEEERLITQIKPMLITTDQQVEQLKQLLIKQDASALADFTIHQLYPAIDPISDIFSELIDLQLTVASADYALMKNTENHNEWTVIILFSVAFVLITLTATLIIRNLRLSTRSMSKAMAAASAGNFSNRATVIHADEIGQTAMQLNLLLEDLQQAITQAN